VIEEYGKMIARSSASSAHAILCFIPFCFLFFHSIASTSSTVRCVKAQAVVWQTYATDSVLLKKEYDANDDDDDDDDDVLKKEYAENVNDDDDGDRTILIDARVVSRESASGQKNEKEEEEEEKQPLMRWLFEQSGDVSIKIIDGNNEIFVSAEFDERTKRFIFTAERNEYFSCKAVFATKEHKKPGADDDDDDDDERDRRETKRTLVDIERKGVLGEFSRNNNSHNSSRIISTTATKTLEAIFVAKERGEFVRYEMNTTIDKDDDDDDHENNNNKNNNNNNNTNNRLISNTPVIDLSKTFREQGTSMFCKEEEEEGIRTQFYVNRRDEDGDENENKASSKICAICAAKPKKAGGRDIFHGFCLGLNDRESGFDIARLKNNFGFTYIASRDFVPKAFQSVDDFMVSLEVLKTDESVFRIQVFSSKAFLISSKLKSPIEPIVAYSSKSLSSSSSSKKTKKAKNKKNDDDDVSYTMHSIAYSKFNDDHIDNSGNQSSNSQRQNIGIFAIGTEVVVNSGGGANNNGSISATTYLQMFNGRIDDIGTAINSSQTTIKWTWILFVVLLTIITCSILSLCLASCYTQSPMNGRSRSFGVIDWLRWILNRRNTGDRRRHRSSRRHRRRRRANIAATATPTTTTTTSNIAAIDPSSDEIEERLLVVAEEVPREQQINDILTNFAEDSDSDLSCSSSINTSESRSTDDDDDDDDDDDELLHRSVSDFFALVNNSPGSSSSPRYREID
jgi:hypothetical protein